MAVDNDIKKILRGLSSLDIVDPKAAAKFKDDFKKLDSAVEANTKEFSATSRDVANLRKIMNRLNVAVNKGIRGFDESSDSFRAAVDVSNRLEGIQAQWGEVLSENVDKLKDNDALQERNNELLQIKIRNERIRESERKKDETVRRNLERSYNKQLRVLISKRRKFERNFTKGITNLRPDTQRDKFRERVSDKSASRSQRISSGIGRNIRSDISDNVLSKLKINTLDKSATGNTLSKQLESLKSFISIREAKKAKTSATDISNVRGIKSPMNRILQAMWLESKSPRSKLIIVNMVKDLLIRPFKTAFKTVGQFVKRGMINLLNLPFNIMKKIFSSFKNVGSDVFTRIFKGKDALTSKVDTRNTRLEEQRVDKEEKFNDDLGIGIDKLTEVLEKYLNLVSRSPDLKRESVNFNKDRMDEIDKSINLLNNKFGIGQDVENQSITSVIPEFRENGEGISSFIPQEQEQFDDNMLAHMIQQTALLSSIDSKVGLGIGDGIESSTGGITGLIRGIIGKLKGIGPAILAALGLGVSGGIGAKLLSIIKKTPWLIALTALGKGISETIDEFKDQGNILDNTLEVIRLGSQNIVTAIPSLLDSTIFALTGFKTDLKGFVDGLFTSTNLWGATLGSAARDFYDNARSILFGEETLEDVNRRVAIEQHAIQQEKEMSGFMKEQREDRVQNESIIQGLENESTTYNPNERGRNPFAPSGTPSRSINLDVNKPDINKNISSKLPIRVTSAAETDSKHRKGSKHFLGQAVDITPPGFGGLPNNNKRLSDANPKAAQAYAKTANMLRGMGLEVTDEYSSGVGKGKSSARHIHVEGSKEQISDLLQRAETLKSNVRPLTAASNHKELRAKGIVSQARDGLNKTARRGNTMPTTAPIIPKIVNKVMPAPVYVDRNMDASVDMWGIYSNMMNQ